MSSPPPVGEKTEAKPGSKIPPMPMQDDTTSAPPAGSTRRKGAGKRFFSAYAQTWIGMSPLWLMGEAIVPGQKVGGTFKKGFKKLGGSAEELLDVLGVSKDDVLVIIDQKFTSIKKASDGALTAATTTSGGAGGDSDWAESSKRAAEVIRAAGEHAIVAVSTSIEKAQAQIHSSSPELKRTVAKHGRDVVVLVDKSLKNPIVVSGVSKFARSKGIPYSEALLQVASMGLARILAMLPEEVEESVEGTVLDEAQRRRRQEGRPTGSGVREMDAAELERVSSNDARAEAQKAGKLGEGSPERVEEGEAPAKGDKCVIS